ncbi:hypothetical protein L596_009109 [Steinernema carpocapsae]|uniref:FAD dependent oxidoreductase domain-containing protein n=1 Tax=Steinernema carpocapsae TaxID=34508 RepID=A0A4U5PEE7_STECR|nr:hypothetical protein L596_009109 [Steinernema carpocapsae]
MLFASWRCHFVPGTVGIAPVFASKSHYCPLFELSFLLGRGFVLRTTLTAWRWTVRSAVHLCAVFRLPEMTYLKLLSLLISIALCAGNLGSPRKVAIIGAGVIGASTALAFKERDPTIDVTIFFDRPFNETTSWGPAGLFRLDNGKYRKWGHLSYKRFTKLFKEYGGISGVQRISGYILSKNITNLISQQINFGDYAYDFHFLRSFELEQFPFPEDEIYGVHYTAYTTEGRTYVPWMHNLLATKYRYNTRFIKAQIKSVDQLLGSYDVVVNCAGLNGGIVANDGDAANVYPIRGVILEVDAPWQKHFFYYDFRTFTIPTINKVFMGTVKQDGRADLQITPEDIDDIRTRYCAVQPAFKDVAIKSMWSGLRPGRDEVRLERVEVPKSKTKVIHNYGHGGNGFTLSWGCALEAVDLAFK